LTNITPAVKGNSVSAPSDEYFNGTIYISLLSATVAVHRPY